MDPTDAYVQGCMTCDSDSPPVDVIGEYPGTAWNLGSGAKEAVRDTLMNAANEPALTGGTAGRRVVLLLLGLGLGVGGGCFLGLLKGALKHPYTRAAGSSWGYGAINAELGSGAPVLLYRA